jgi:recombinational DNA repair protein (RecF pathway)
MTQEAASGDCPLDVAACYFEVWMLRLAGVFPDLFRCGSCGRELTAEEERWLRPGLQSTACSGCDRTGAVTVHPDVAPVLQWVLRNRLDGTVPGGGERGRKSLRELNQYWIRNYFER